MHSRAVLTVLVVILSVSIVGFRFQVRENLHLGSSVETVVSHVSNSKQTFAIVDSWIDALPRSLVQIKNPNNRLSYVKQTVSEIEKLRAAQGFQGIRQEIQLDFYVEPLKILTQAPKFDHSNCPEWNHRLVADYAPNETGEIQHPQLKKVQRIIASICQ